MLRRENYPHLEFCDRQSYTNIFHPNPEVVVKKCVGSLKKEYLKGKRVFVRVDLDVPLDDNFDDTRIRATVPTIKYLMKCRSRVILASNRGRPIRIIPMCSLKPIVPILSELLGIEVKMANDCIGHQVENMVREIPEGGVLLLENLRFHREEIRANESEFAKKLASVADLYVNDAFANANRSETSTIGVARYVKPAVAGFLVKKEHYYLCEVIVNPKKPFVGIVGGSKLSTKIGIIDNLMNKGVNLLLIGGGLIFTFYKAVQGYSVGSSLVEEKKILNAAKSLIDKAKAKGVTIKLPSDVVIADKFGLVLIARLLLHLKFRIIGWG